MPGSFKHANIGQLCFCPEMVQDSPIWKLQINGGTTSPPTLTAAMGSAIANHYNGNIDTTVNNNDWYNGLFAYCKSGSNAGQIRKITDYTCATGAAPQTATFTLTNAAPGETVDLTNAIGATETWYFFAALPASNVSPTLEVEKIQREYETLTFDPPPFVAGLMNSGVSFDCEIAGLEQPRDAATGSGSVDPDRWGHLLQGLGSRVVGAGSTVVNPSTGSNSPSKIYLTSTAGFTSDRIPSAGKSNMIMFQDTGALYRGSNNDEIRRVVSVGTDAGGSFVTVAPNLSSTPVATKEAYAGECFVPAELNHVAMTFLYLKDDQIFEMPGCLISVSGSWNYGQLITLSIDSAGSSWYVYDNDGWDNVQSSNAPIPVLEGSAFFNESLSADPAIAGLPMTEFGFDYAVERTIQKVTTGQTMKINNRTPVMNLKFADADANLKQSTSAFSELQGSKGYLIAQGGVSAGSAVALLAFGQIESMPITEQDGIMYWDASLKHVDGDMQSNPYKMLIYRF